MVGISAYEHAMRVAVRRNNMAGIVELPLQTQRSEVWRYLGFSPTHTQLDDATELLLDKCIAAYSSDISPQGIALTIELQNQDARLLMDEHRLYLGSPSLTAMLSGASLVTIMVVTLGHQIDASIDRLFSGGKYAEAVMLDAIGSDAAENAANSLQEIVKKSLVGRGLCPTPRVSPGYGDIGLPIQAELLRILKGHHIGVELTSAYMLKPRKSITAIVGWLTEALVPSGHEGCKCSICKHTWCAYQRGDSPKGEEPL